MGMAAATPVCNDRERYLAHAGGEFDERAVLESLVLSLDSNGGRLYTSATTLGL